MLQIFFLSISILALIGVILISQSRKKDYYLPPIDDRIDMSSLFKKWE
jgi:hypothetical protein